MNQQTIDMLTEMKMTAMAAETRFKTLHSIRLALKSG